MTYKKVIILKIYSRKKNTDKDDRVESIEDHSAYFDSAMKGGQQPALKRTMRAFVGSVINWLPKIGLKVIGWLRMRLNYQNSSNFGYNSTFSWYQQLHDYLSTLKVKIYLLGYSYAKTLLNLFRTCYKRVSLIINSRVIHATGEVSELRDNECCNSFSITNGDGRGFVVLMHLIRKEPKHFTCHKIGQVRSYATKSGRSNLALVQGQEVEIPKGLQVLAKHWLISYQSPNKIFYDLRGILKQESLWFAAYIKLNSNKGSKTAGPDGEIIDYLTKSWILELREAVLKNEFLWSGVSEIINLKAGKQKKFIPLEIPAMKDRLVQEVIRSIIEPIFEFGFSNNSHGFRPNRSCHTALKWMNTKMKDSIWFIEGDIKSYFPSINHQILMRILELKVQDPTILKLIRTGLKAKVFQKDNKIYIPEIATRQGAILSPLLSNIYLNELDKYIKELCDQYKGHVKAGNRKNNPLALQSLRSGKKSRYLGLIIPNKIYDEVGYRNINYLRYADDFVIGVSGPDSMAIEIRDKLKDFLKDKLHIELSTNKTKITHVSKGIPFLGYRFSKKTLLVKQIYHGKERVINKTITTIDVNMKRVIACLSEANFCKADGTPVPAFRFLRLPQSETNQKVKYILRGLSEYWSIAGNRKALVARAAYILRYSIAKVYAAKFKLKTVAAVFKRGGNSLANPLGKRIKSVVGADERNTPSAKKVELTGILYDRSYKIPKPQGNKLEPNWTPKHVTYLAKQHFDASKLIEDVWKIRDSSTNNPLAAMAWKLEKTISSKGARCAVCNSTADVQMHHGRSLKDIDKSIKVVKQHAISIYR